MITIESLNPQITIIDPIYICLQVDKLSRVMDNGVELTRYHTAHAFHPGQIEDVKEFLDVDESPEITYINALWTEDVINKYQETLTPVPPSA